MTTELITKETTKPLELLKSAANEIATKCNAIEITDDTSLAIGTQIISDANKIVKQIDVKRTELKAPYLQAGKEIDSIAKDISFPLDAAVTLGKQKILNYTQIKEREKQKELYRIAGIKEAIILYKNTTISAIDKCTTQQELVVVNTERIKTFPADTEWMEFNEEAQAMRKNLHEYAKAKKNTLLDPMNHQAEAAMEEQKAAVDLVTETIAEEEIAAIEIQKPTGLRNNWRFEVVDITKVPPSLLLVDEAKVKAWAKQMREAGGLIDGSIHFGIKHFTEQTVVLK